MMAQKEELANWAGGYPSPLPKGLKKGKTGPDVKLLQEFLMLNDYSLELDGIFGPVTNMAVADFATCFNTVYSLEVNSSIWNSLTRNYNTAIRRLKAYPTVDDFMDIALAYAKQHLKARAQELRGRNEGPFVRLYMQGYEGPEFFWCLGFVSFVITQATISLNIHRDHATLPGYTFSCDALAKWALSKGKLSTNPVKLTYIKPGAIFLVYRGGNNWIHGGFVEKGFVNGIVTIEGNTNLKGHREGTHVMRRYRSLKNLHIINSYGISRLPIRGKHAHSRKAVV